MLYLAAEGWSSRQIGDPVDDDIWSGFKSVSGLGLQEPTVSELVLRPWTIYSQVVDEYEGGTVAATVFVEAELHVEALMFKSDALASDSGTTSVLELDFNRHYSRVAVEPTVVVELEFNAIITPEAESVDDFQLTTINLLESA